MATATPPPTLQSVHSWSLCAKPDESGWKLMSTQFQTADKWIKLLGAILPAVLMVAPSVAVLKRLQDMTANARLLFPTFMLGGGIVTLYDSGKEAVRKGKANEIDKQFGEKSTHVVKESINIARAVTSWAAIANHPFAAAMPGFTCAAETAKLVDFGFAYDKKRGEGVSHWVLLLAFSVIVGDLFLSVNKLNAFTIPAGLKNGLSLFTAAGGLYDWKGKLEKDVDMMNLGKMQNKWVSVHASREPLVCR